MSCRTSLRRSARSCATNIFWDTARVTNHTTGGGARSKSSCTPPGECRLSASPRKQVTTGAASKFSWLQVLRPRLDCASFALPAEDFGPHMVCFNEGGQYCERDFQSGHPSEEGRSLDEAERQG